MAIPSDLDTLRVIDLGRMPYARAYVEQVARVEALIAGRAANPGRVGDVLLVEHDPVVTITRKPGVREHLIASPEFLAAQGVSIEETDRGGDITYHGPGQLVVYPILDLNRLNLGLHDYMRLLEACVIETCGAFGVAARRDPAATGVWVNPKGHERDADVHPGAGKICAMGVRVRRWVSMHGLAINVRTNLRHFALIVPCGLSGRPVTSVEHELGSACPSFDEVKREFSTRLMAMLHAAAQTADRRRQKAATPAS